MGHFITTVSAPTVRATAAVSHNLSLRSPSAVSLTGDGRIWTCFGTSYPNPDEAPRVACSHGVWTSRDVTHHYSPDSRVAPGADYWPCQDVRSTDQLFGVFSPDTV